MAENSTRTNTQPEFNISEDSINRASFYYQFASLGTSTRSTCARAHITQPIMKKLGIIMKTELFSTHSTYYMNKDVIKYMNYVFGKFMKSFPYIVNSFISTRTMGSTVRSSRGIPPINHRMMNGLDPDTRSFLRRGMYDREMLFYIPIPGLSKEDADSIYSRYDLLSRTAFDDINYPTRLVSLKNSYTKPITAIDKYISKIRRKCVENNIPVTLSISHVSGSMVMSIDNNGRPVYCRDRELSTEALTNLRYIVLKVSLVTETFGHPIYSPKLNSIISSVNTKLSERGLPPIETGGMSRALNSCIPADYVYFIIQLYFKKMLLNTSSVYKVLTTLSKLVLVKG